MREREARRPMPVEQAISWKPLRDPHYVVASLQPGDGGRRKIFVRQQVLSRVESIVRAHGRRACGLLLGQEYQCSETGANYMVVETVAEQDPVDDESEVHSRIKDAVAHHSTHRSFHLGLREHPQHVLGWYRGVPTLEAKPQALTASVHIAAFDQPWHTLLVVSEPGRAQGGAFFLNDTGNRQWFYAPFYELPDHLAKPYHSKPTVVNWPEYMTVDNVALTAREPGAVTGLADVLPATPTESPHHGARATTNGNGAARRSTFDLLDTRIASAAPDPLATTLPPPSAHASPSTRTSIDPSPIANESPTVNSDPPLTNRDSPLANSDSPLANSDPPLTDRTIVRPVHDELGAATKPRESGPSRRVGRSIEKLSVIDDRDQRVAPRPGRKVRDDDDTTSTDDPARFIEIARAEGFFIAATFDTPSGFGRVETLWILNEPFSGMLLAVVTTDSEVVDATLHYNLQTDDAGLQRVPFPEHRDPDSKTIYVRETCVDGLRARCRRLRETNSLVREWRVTPAISFLTPAEWESVSTFAMSNEGTSRVLHDRNAARIAELPEGVRTQFHLGFASDDHA